MPKIDYSACHYTQAIKRIHQYNTTQEIAIEEILPLKTHIQEFLEMQNLTVFSSSMPRAIITAQALFNEKYNIIKDDRFIEFDLHFIQIPFIKLKFETWALISRILWFMGMLKTKKSVRSELLRAKNNANFLCEQVRKNNVVLVSHGLLNMFIERDLKKQGYKRVSKITNGFFSTIKLEHTVVNN